MITKVLFEYNEHLLYTPEELNTAFPDRVYSPEALPLPARRYRWLQEIAENKRTLYPYLSKLDIEEN